MARLVWIGAKIDVSVPPHPCAYSGQDKKKKFNLKKKIEPSSQALGKKCRGSLNHALFGEKINLLLHTSLIFFFQCLRKPSTK